MSNHKCVSREWRSEMTADRRELVARTGVGALLAAVLVVMAPAIASSSSSPTDRAYARCDAGVESVDVQGTSVRVTDTKVSRVRIHRAGGAGFNASSRVKVTGTGKATVEVRADACPGGASTVRSATQTAEWTGSKTGRAKRVWHPLKRSARKDSIKQATQVGKDLLQAAAVKIAQAEATSAALAASTTTGIPTPTPTPTPPTAEEIEAFRVKVRDAVLKYTNIERAKAGVGPLVSLQPVTIGAQNWAQNMTERGVLEHAAAAEIGNNPGVEQCTSQTALTEIIVGFGGVSEFTDYFADMDARSSVASWVSSPGHYAQLISADYSRTGIGIGIFPSTTPGRWRIGTVQRPWGGDCPQYPG